jgi:hypothetical protein
MGLPFTSLGFQPQADRANATMTMTQEPNPVVLLTDNTWHIVAHSRESYVAWCGKKITDRRAHSRLNTIGRENLCPKCLSFFFANSQDWQS